MPIQLLMPALSPTMTEGNLAKWHKKEGDPVKAGDVVAEIETDKATMEIEAVDEGTLGRILVPEGAQGVKVNQPIALILGEDEDPKALDDVTPAAAKPEAKAEVKPEAKPEAEPAKPPPSKPPVEAAPPAAKPAAAPAPHEGGKRVFASPLARRLAEQAKLDLSAITGSGPHGRIVRADVEAAVKSGGATARAPVPGGAAPVPGVAYSRDQVVALAGNLPYTEVPLTGMRRTIARRLTEAKQVIPHFYLTVDCEIDALLKVRADINDALGIKLSVNDFVIKATALALRKVPAANASWSEDAILRWESVDVAVAVALPDGLITPIIKNADKKAVPAISAEMRELAERAKSNKLKPAEFQGGTVSISNLGMYGVQHFTAIINPPHSCIIAVGAGEKRAVVKNDALAIATVMSCTVACDHRVVDGATAAQLMAAFRKLIEAPAALLL